MAVKTTLLSYLFIISIFASACSRQNNNSVLEASDDNLSEKTSVLADIAENPIKEKYKTKHPYGGYSCPDNLKGFPPIDIQQLDLLPIVNDRLPTEEETKDGTSLLFFDLEKYPDAQPLNMKMPRAARYYSEYTKKNELIVVIQAVVANSDTIVGFRYLNGGNGSAFFGEVYFLSDDEIEQLGSTRFVNTEMEINASKEKIWEVITNKDYAKELGAEFDKNAFIESDWKDGSAVNFKYEPDRIVSTGYITALWENMYIQIDYNFNGFHYVEKFFMSHDEFTNRSSLHLAAGPYTSDYDAQKEVWNNWLNKVKELSESE